MIDVGQIRRRIGKSKVTGFFFVIAFVLLLPIILPFALIQGHFETRRIKKVIRNFICSCGTRLGDEAIRLGNQRWAAIIAEMHARYPGVKPLIRRSVHAVCPTCGCEYRYREADASLIPNPHQKQAASTTSRENP